MRSTLVALSLLLLTAPVGCASLRAYPNANPMVVDQDRQPFGPRPAKYFSGLIWDGMDQMVFRPIANFFAVDPAGESVNVTAADEVADSSWFENRIGKRAMTPEELATGACWDAPPLDPKGPWTITGGKPNGENPGFFIKGQDGSRYLLKFDGAHQAPRATSADVIVSRIYWAAGYYVPCNRIVLFNKDILTIAPDAAAEKPDGTKSPMSQELVDNAFKRAMQLPDGRYRANASLYLNGRPLGPWRYESTRDDDANDIIPHEDRREIRAAATLASWVNHFDSREQNTLDMWVKTDGDRGYIKHHYLDFGDCFGSIWEWDSLTRRWGHSYFFAPQHIFADFFTFGFISRPWDRTDIGVTGEVFGYFDIDRFEPDAWYNEYPNPAFSRISEHDATWMARIIARFTDAHIDAAIETGRYQNPLYPKELRRLLIGRRDKVLQRYLTHLSPLADPELVPKGDDTELCLNDLAVTANVVPSAGRAYDTMAWLGLELVEASAPARLQDVGRVCVTLPRRKVAHERDASYLIVDVTARSGPVGLPLRAHLYQTGPNAYRLVGIERPDDDDAPGD